MSKQEATAKEALAKPENKKIKTTTTRKAVTKKTAEEKINKQTTSKKEKVIAVSKVAEKEEVAEETAAKKNAEVEEKQADQVREEVDGYQKESVADSNDSEVESVGELDFKDDGFDDRHSEADRKIMEKLYEETLTRIYEKELVNGTVVGITDRDVIINIGFKSDGLIPLSEFRDTPDLKAGDEVQVYLEEQENASGQLVLSRRKAKIVKAWESIQNALNNNEIIEGFIKRRTKGGLIVDVYGIESFLPGSQIDVKPIRDFDVFVGKSMEVKVVKINHTNDNVVVSHKVLIEKDIEQQKAEILNNLEKGQVLEA